MYDCDILDFHDCDILDFPRVKKQDLDSYNNLMITETTAPERHAPFSYSVCRIADIGLQQGYVLPF